MFDAVRSFLFVPGDSEKKIAKALEGSADALILDLEDAVAPENRLRARGLCLDVLGAQRSKPLVVRMNGLRTPDARPDLAAVLRGCPDGIMLPKCAGLDDVKLLGHYLDVLEAREGLEAGRTAILPIITETAAAILAGASYREGHPRLTAMLWGGEDLAADLGASRNRGHDRAYTSPYLAARSLCLFAAVSASAVGIDAVYTDFRDGGGLRAEAAEALHDGFGSKAAIHPAQVDIINDVFTPDPETIARAEAIVSVLAGGKTVAVLDGRLVEAPHLKAARKIIARSALVSGSRTKGGAEPQLT
ncbi:CoA ester lyase [Mesorhizobium sp. LHD-90]|uniref:HpcH/HpaI aldolase/citrate lyase family protein n=1 Tax=Mesorhizobium sp. LHD-90 TaxID=3071414 RepID=UPI0027E0378D|nr:CoA ester lyase [Mesorhizobium sp. LHD-90]MDQ6433210.1 CoA ester lyase [Mesorhizobium sp. LHD-90]